jgi:hypothetical protein
VKRFAAFALVFVCGLGIGWVLHQSRPQNSPGAEYAVAVDCAQEIHITRMHPKQPFAQTLQPIHITRDGRQTRLGDTPPDDDPVWLITCNGGSTIITATQDKTIAN